MDDKQFYRKITRRNFVKASCVSIAALSLGFWGKTVQAFSPFVMTDFGGLISRKVLGQAFSLSEIDQAVQSDIRFHPRGTGHSCMGQSLEEGTVIFGVPSGEITLTGENVFAPAGATLLEIDNFLAPQGFMLPVSPDHRSLSLGGVLSVGGYGSSSFKHGGLVDHVVSLDLLSDDGTVTKSVPVENERALKALAGVGQFDTILAATIKTAKKPEKTLVKKILFGTVDEYVDMARRFIKENNDQLIGRQDQMDLFYSVWHGDTRLAVYGQSIYQDTPVNPFLKGRVMIQEDIRAFQKQKTDQWAFSKPYKYHIWSDHSVPIESLQTQLEQAVELKKQAEKMGGDVVMFSMINKANKKHSHFHHYSIDDYVVSVGLYANFVESQKEQAEAFSNLQVSYSKQSQIHQKAKPYLYGWHWKDEQNR